MFCSSQYYHRFCLSFAQLISRYGLQPHHMPMERRSSSVISRLTNTVLHRTSRRVRRRCSRPDEICLQLSRDRPNLYGVPWLGGCDKFKLHLPDSAVTSFCRHLLFATTAFLLIAIFWQDRTFARRLHDAIPSCTNSVVTGVWRFVLVDMLQMLMKSWVITQVISRPDYCSATLGGVPKAHLRRFQSNGRLFQNCCWYDSLWTSQLDARRPPLIPDFRTRCCCVCIAVLLHRCLHDIAPCYLAYQIRQLADVPNRRQLRSAFIQHLRIRFTDVVSAGDAAFKIAAAKAWNSLPDNITAAPSIGVFGYRRAHLFFRRLLFHVVC